VVSETFQLTQQWGITKRQRLAKHRRVVKVSTPPVPAGTCNIIVTTAPCGWCGCRWYWRDRYSVTHCGHCHPAGDPDAATGWLELIDQELVERDRSTVEAAAAAWRPATRQPDLRWRAADAIDVVRELLLERLHDAERGVVRGLDELKFSWIEAAAIRRAIVTRRRYLQGRVDRVAVEEVDAE